MSTLYPLAMCRDYVAHWGVQEAVRELIQNAIDSDSPFEYEYDSGTLILRSKNTRLHPRTLLMGQTTKSREDDNIGSFGEGYKLALLVLTRLERPVTLYNEDEIWRPMFIWDAGYESDVLNVQTGPVLPENKGKEQGLSFVVEGLTDEEWEGIVESCLLMQPLPDSEELTRIDTYAGTILLDKPKTLYVGGLYICDTQLNHGYDIHPGKIELGRDRRAVDTFNLQWLTKDMWFDADDPESVAQMMADDAPDMEYAKFSTPEVVKEACYALFQKEYNGKIAAANQKELEDLVSRGMTNVVVVSSSNYHGALTSSSGYHRDTKKLAPVPQPKAQLQGWFRANKKGMNDVSQIAFARLVKRSETWKNQ